MAAGALVVPLTPPSQEPLSAQEPQLSASPWEEAPPEPLARPSLERLPARLRSCPGAGTLGAIYILVCSANFSTALQNDGSVT